MSSTFDYVAYDVTAQENSEEAKTLAKSLEGFIKNVNLSPREKALALTKLEECFMWIGKGIRNDQISRRQLADAGIQKQAVEQPIPADS